MQGTRFVRLAAVALSAVWLGATACAQGEPQPGASPLASPLDSSLASPIPTPHADTALCTVATPCPPDEIAQTPSAFQSFFPSLGASGGTEAGLPAASLPAAPLTPPDLGMLLNYVAVGVIIVGVTLKAYWYISDRRKASRVDGSTHE